MTHTVIHPDSTVFSTLSYAAEYQFGPNTNVKEWRLESSDHGRSFHGFDFNGERWLRVHIDLDYQN